MDKDLKIVLGLVAVFVFVHLLVNINKEVR